MNEYTDFLAGKRLTAAASGIRVDGGDIHASLFDHQRDITRWSLAKGHAAAFLDAGLGKTRIQLGRWSIGAAGEARSLFVLGRTLIARCAAALVR